MCCKYAMVETHFNIFLQTISVKAQSRAWNYIMKKQELINYIDNKMMDKLFGFCYAHANDSYEAQELCSDIMYALVKTAHTDGEIKSLYPFIWRVAKNVYFDFVKNKKRHQAVFSDENPEALLALTADDDYDNENQDLLEAVYRQIAFLTKTYREVMILYYIDGLNAAEIAKMQNTSETNVRQRLLWARGKVRNGVKDLEKTNDRPLALDQMHYDICGSGETGWGDPREVGTRTLSKHIIWLCRKKPAGAAEIAEKLKVPAVYIEEELEVLANGKNGVYGLLRRMGNNKYIINFVLLDKAAMKKAAQIYKGQMPKICRIVADYVEAHREEYLSFPYLNRYFAEGRPDFNLVLWQQMSVLARAFRNNVNRILAENYFAHYEEPQRPFSVFGYVDAGVSYSENSDRIHAENLCGFKYAAMNTLFLLHVSNHFTCGHNMSDDPQIQMALRAIGGLNRFDLADDEKEHAAKAVECGYLYREKDMLYTRILVCPLEEEERLFEVSGRLSEGHFEQEAQEVAEQIAVLIKKSIPKHLFGEWRFANALASMALENLMENELIKQGILTPPKDGIGAEGCWLSVG